MTSDREKEKFTKTDMERVALFQEMGYVSIGDKYKTTDNTASFNQAAGQGKQMLCGGAKTKSALQSGYFNDKFVRVLEGEAYSDQVKMRRQYRLRESQKNIGKPFVPSSGEKKWSGLGSYYGTLSGPIPAISPLTKPSKEYKAPGKNFYTNPGKKGTGYGYAPVTIGRYHEYETGDKYDVYRDITKRDNEAHKKSMTGGPFKLNMASKSYFDENPFKTDKPLPPPKKPIEKTWDVKPFKPCSPSKRDGGMKAGTFDAYPSHSAEPFRTKATGSRDQLGANKQGRPYVPPPGPKSAPTPSVLDQNIVSCRLNDGSDGAVRTVAGRAFHTGGY